MRLSDIVRKKFSYIPGMDLSNPDPKEKKHSLWRFFIFFQTMVFLYGAYFSNFFSRKCLYFGLEFSISKPEKQKKTTLKKFLIFFQKCLFLIFRNETLLSLSKRLLLYFRMKLFQPQAKTTQGNKKSLRKNFWYFSKKGFFHVLG